MKNYIERILKLYDMNDILIESILISVFIIVIDVFNLVSLAIENNLLYILILLLVCYLIKIVEKTNLKKLILNSITEFDKYVVEYSFVMIFLTFYILLFNYKVYKMVLIISSLLVYFIILLVRTKKNKAQKVHNKNILDLKKICDNLLELKNYDEMVLIEESDVDYDLLNRKALINHLYNTIIKSYPSKSFTIGLNGKWGSGKTTIINNVLKNMKDNKELSNYIIVKFDPWMFNDEKMMLESFLKEILKTMNFNISYSNKNEIINDVITSVFSSDYTSIIKYVLNKINSSKKNPNITKIVNNYLENNEKRLIIIIDNLDRIDGEKALFLIKCLDSVLNFENTINILLYDEEIINKVLSDKFNFNAKYMEKLVQLKIEIPVIDKHILDGIKNKVSNNLIYNGKRIIEFVNEDLYEFDNLRELKRYMNSIISLALDTRDELNSRDYSVLKYIQLKCPELYYEIWNNKKYYILYDRKYDPELYTFDYKGLNISAKKYFDDLYKNEKYKDYLKYAEKLFPNMVNSQKVNYDVFSYYMNEAEYSESVLNNRISNTRYFDLYFTDEANDFTRLRKDVTEAISLINESHHYYKKLEDRIKSYDSDELKVFMEIFYLSVDDINEEKHADLVSFLLKILPHTKQRIMFGELDSKQRLYIIVAKLMSKISTNEFDKIKVLFTDNYKHLHILSNIKYWIDAYKEKGLNYSFNFDDLYNSMCSKIINENINIYSLENYTRGNVWVLYRYDNEKTKKYLKNIIDKRNVYLLLNDLISISSGTNGYGYSINEENIRILIPDIDLKKLMKKNELTEKEQFIKRVYEESMKQNDEFKKGIYLNEYIEL